MRTNTISYLITEGLGYCCPHHFFKLYATKKTALIAARLGVTTRAVRYAKAAYREGSMPDCGVTPRRRV